MAKKLHISKTGTTVALREGTKTLWKIEGIALARPRLEGVVAAQDPDTVIEDELRAAIEAAQQKRGSVIPDQYRYGYGVDQNCGDDIAQRLKDATTDGHGKADMRAVQKVAEANGLAPDFDRWVSKGLNNGMVRMNLGNKLRGLARKGTEVAI